jgi:hypothetical protein
MKMRTIAFTALAVGALVLLFAYTRFSSTSTIPSTVVFEATPIVRKEVIPQAPTLSARPETAQSTPQPTPPPMTENSPKPNDQIPNFSQAQPVRAKGLAQSIRWLDANEAASFPFDKFRSTAVRLSPSDSWKPRIIAGREEAINYLNTNHSMARLPTVAFEDDEFFYFSGGNTAYPVKEFSRGIAVSKATGEITAW